MSITIEPIENPEQRKLFVEAPLSIYRSESRWIRPLDDIVLSAIGEKKNPFYRDGAGKAFLAKWDQKIVGRILAHVSFRHQRLHAEKVGYFGLFECVNDLDVAGNLLSAAENFLKQKQCDMIRGPFNITAAQEMGIVTDGFDKTPAIDMVYTPEWYPHLFKKLGYYDCFTMATWRNENIQTWKCSDAKIKLNEKFKIKIRPLRSFARNADMELVREVVNSAFLGNWNFFPITREEWNLQVGELLPVMDPDIVQLAEENGVIVGVSLVVPDYNRIFQNTGGQLLHWRSAQLLAPSSVKHAVVILFAVRKAFQGMGINKKLNYRLMEILKKKGYQSLSITWIGSQNQGSLAQARYLGMRKLHQLTMYEKGFKNG